MNLPATDDIRKLRDILETHRYSAADLKQRFGITAPPVPGDRGRLLHLTREARPENALVRLFLLGATIAEDSDDVLPDGLLHIGREAGLLEVSDGRIRPRVVIVPVEHLLFASDAFDMLGSDRANDFVVPASTHAANFLRRLTLRAPIQSALDLGCGCGIQALFAAAHSERVVATDISESAVAYTRFNAALNGIGNVDCRVGDRFAPVAGEKFDLIVSNPPFVLGPGGQFTYRDSNLELDEFCRELVTATPGFLNDGGHAQLLCESVEIGGEAWPDRIRGWVTGTGCDAWVLHTPPVHPLHYAARRLADVQSSTPGPGSYEDWVGYFETREVTAIHPAMMTLRKRRGRNWVHFHGVADDIDSDAGDAVRGGIAACDLLDRCSDDDALLASRLRLSPSLQLEQQFVRDDEQWRPQHSLLRMSNGLRMDAEVDMQIIAFLHQLDPGQTLREIIDRFAGAVHVPADKLAADLLPVMRIFIGRGFVESAAS